MSSFSFIKGTSNLSFCDFNYLFADRNNVALIVKHDLSSFS